MNALAFGLFVGMMVSVAWQFVSCLPMGTKSLLFGVHQFLWHPFTVWRAWRFLYRENPTWRECVCIFIHDWGYWGCAEMDGDEGALHPYFGADLAEWMFGTEHGELVRWHSRTLAMRNGVKPSKLCWADKFSMLYDADRFYLLRARATGEIAEYRRNAMAHIPLNAHDRVWLRWLKARLTRLAEQQAKEVVS